MSSCLFNHRENRRRRVPAFSCTYCRKTFTTRQARRKHFIFHQEEVQLRRRRYCSGCSSNRNLLVSSTNIQPENLGAVTTQNTPLLNLEDSPSEFSQDYSLLNVSSNTANIVASGNSHLYAPSNLSSDGGCTESRLSNYLSMAPAAKVNAGTTSLDPPISFPSDPSSFGGGIQVSLFTANERKISQGPVNPMQNFLYHNLRIMKPYIGDVGKDAQIINIPRRITQVSGSRQLVQSEERSKKELLLFRDVSCIVVSPDTEEEVQDLDLSLHL